MTVNRPYYEAVPDLENIYLEDSYVLGIKDDADELSFDLLCILTEEHPLYTPPIPDEQYGCKTARLSFSGRLVVSWIERNLNAGIVDPDGSVDFGNIDIFETSPEGYYLSGEWGKINIACNSIALTFRDVPISCR